MGAIGYCYKSDFGHSTARSR